MFEVGVLCACSEYLALKSTSPINERGRSEFPIEEEQAPHSSIDRRQKPYL